mgnify:CR=1 FL=1
MLIYFQKGEIFEFLLNKKDLPSSKKEVFEKVVDSLSFILPACLLQMQQRLFPG